MSVEEMKEIMVEIAEIIGKYPEALQEKAFDIMTEKDVYKRQILGTLASDSYCAIRTSEVLPRKPRISPSCFCVIPFLLRKNLIRCPIAIIISPSLIIVFFINPLFQLIL